MSLSPAQERELREDLEALEAALGEQLDTSRNAAGPVDLDEPIGRVSRVDALQQQHMVQAGRRAAALRRQQVEAALRRLAQGEYGACLVCGEAVGFARLKVRPEAPLCLACQAEREERG